MQIMWAKVAWLQSTVGLHPWYQAGAAPPPPPPSATPPPTPTTTRAPTTTPKATPTPTRTSAPTTIPKATLPPAGAACLANVAAGQPWSIGGGQYSVSMTLVSGLHFFFTSAWPRASGCVLENVRVECS